MRALGWLLLPLMLLLASPALAQPATAEAQAREYFKQGTEHFNAGRYAEAEIAFSAGYTVSKRPGFLWNMAETARLRGAPDRAYELYGRFLEHAPLDDSLRPEAEQWRKELAPAPAAPLAQKPPPSRQPPAAAKPAPAVAPSAGDEPPAADGSGPIYSRWWFWAGAGAAVGVTVLAIVLASGSGSSSSENPPPSGTYVVSWQ
jgi:tetratricopeptide (TPR) repeat protein